MTKPPRTRGKWASGFTGTGYPVNRDHPASTRGHVPLPGFEPGAAPLGPGCSSVELQRYAKTLQRTSRDVSSSFGTISPRPAAGPSLSTPWSPSPVSRKFVVPLRSPRGTWSGAVYRQQPREVRQSLAGGASLSRRLSPGMGVQEDLRAPTLCVKQLTLPLGEVCPGRRTQRGYRAWQAGAASLPPGDLPIASGHQRQEVYGVVRLSGALLRALSYM